jgi:hypothetical protein
VDGGLGLLITPANLSEDVDVVEIHQEFYGLPWDAFRAGTEPPAEWVAAMTAIKNSVAASGKQTFLSVTMLNGARNSLQAKTTIVDGTVQSTDGWAAPCYDFETAPDGAAMKQAYLAYVSWMIDLFSPAYLNVAVEVNLFFENCPNSAAGVIDVSNAAYALAKTKTPAPLTFPSIQIDHLYGYASTSCPDAGQREACFENLYAQIAPLKRDRFAMSTYPFFGVAVTPADLPSDWFSRGAAVGGERALIAETGWDSSSLIAQLDDDGMCLPVFSESEPEEEAYLDRVLTSAAEDDLDLVNWWSDRDLIVSQLMTACPCTFDTVWCEVLDISRGPATDGGGNPQFYGEVLFKAFGTMGLRDYEGNPKPTVYPRWSEALELPVVR